MSAYSWKTFRAGNVSQVELSTGEDFAHLAELDPKRWFAISMPVAGVRFDRRTLELLDADGDGRIRREDVLDAVAFLQAKGVDLAAVAAPDEDAARALDDVLARRADLTKLAPSPAEEAAMAAWQAAGESGDVAVLGAETARAEAALAAVEPLIDAFFTPPEDMPLVTDAPDVSLPLKEHLNPKHLEAVLTFAETCVTPLLGARDTLQRMEWKRLKALFAPYRAWRASKPVLQAAALAALEEEERVLRFTCHLREFAENFVNMKRLYDGGARALFQTGTLRIDGKEMDLCFPVENEAAHAALSGKSNCCVLYLKLTRPGEGAARALCAVVTAGRVSGLYVGRNGVFCDRDGRCWDATVTKVVENQVSLAEAFWAPWKKLGDGIAAAVKKFLGDRQKASEASLMSLASAPAGDAAAQQGGAALASSVAAVGIGVGMVGAALASLTAVIASTVWWKLLAALAALVLVVSLPSVILTWFKLRRRDLCAILNAGGWAINRPMRFSVRRARTFTRCAR